MTAARELALASKQVEEGQLEDHPKLTALRNTLQAVDTLQPVSAAFAAHMPSKLQ